MVEIGWIEMPEKVKERSWAKGGGEICRRQLFDILSKKYNVERKIYGLETMLCKTPVVGNYEDEKDFG